MKSISTGIEVNKSHKIYFNDFFLPEHPDALEFNVLSEMKL